MKAPIPQDDALRVAALHRYGILDTPPDPDLQAITDLTAYVTGCPVATVNLVDAHRQWQAATTGIEPFELPRDATMCSFTVATGKLVYVPDTLADPVFATHPMVAGPTGAVRTYAGAPLVTSDGYVLGTLCVLDDQPRQLDSDQLAALEILARQVVHLFVLRAYTQKLASSLAEADLAATHDPLTGLPNRRLVTEYVSRAVASREKGGVFSVNLDGFRAINEQLGPQVGDAVLVEVSRRLLSAVRPGDVVARLGDDRFVVLCPGAPAERLPALERRLRALVNVPMRTAHGLVDLRASIGFADLGRARDAVEALRVADAAMASDKSTRRALRG